MNADFQQAAPCVGQVFALPPCAPGPPPQGQIRLHIDSFLGRGQFGTVYKCKTTSGSEPVALKWMPSVHASHFPKLAREVAVLARVGRHVNIVGLLTSWGSVQQRSLAIVLEYCGGGDLKDYLAQRCQEGRGLPEDTARDFGRQVARGMAFIWSKGCVHRSVGLPRRHLTALAAAGLVVRI